MNIPFMREGDEICFLLFAFSLLCFDNIACHFGPNQKKDWCSVLMEKYVVEKEANTETNRSAIINILNFLIGTQD